MELLHLRTQAVHGPARPRNPPLDRLAAGWADIGGGLVAHLIRALGARDQRHRGSGLRVLIGPTTRHAERRRPASRIVPREREVPGAPCPSRWCRCPPTYRAGGAGRRAPGPVARVEAREAEAGREECAAAIFHGIHRQVSGCDEENAGSRPSTWASPHSVASASLTHRSSVHMVWHASISSRVRGSLQSSHAHQRGIARQFHAARSSSRSRSSAASSSVIHRSNMTPHGQATVTR